MSNNKPKLLVEGQEDLLAIAELMGYHTPWPENKNEAPVFIQPAGGIDELLKPTFIGGFLKERGMEAVGIVIDADDKFDERWNQVRKQCVTYFPNIPTAIPIEGLICENSNNQRLGIWLMPNNQSPGMLETFLSTLITSDQKNNALWGHTVTSTEIATEHGAPYKEVHKHKAQIHTWLAWQDPPGSPFRLAILQKTLNPGAESAKSFVKWFMDLFKLPKLND